jgi:hypothetical protein
LQHHPIFYPSCTHTHPIVSTYTKIAQYTSAT